jgi:hypothetical protein
MFKELRKQQLDAPTTKFTVKFSFFEIYNEKITDLISGKEDCQIRMQQQKEASPFYQTQTVYEHTHTYIRFNGVHVQGFYVEDAAMEECRNVRECMGLYVNGMHNRSVSATQMNKESSRSHCIIQLVLEQMNEGKVGKTDFPIVTKSSDICNLLFIYFCLFFVDCLILLHHHHSLNQLLANSCWSTWLEANV